MLSFSQLMGQVQGPSAQFLPVGGGTPDPTGGGGGIDTGGGGGGGITFGGGFAPIGGGNGSGAGGGGGGGITFGIPGFPGGGGSTGTPTQTTNASFLNPSTWLSSILSFFGCSIQDALLRIAFFILGLICIIGAIYLYKGSNPVLQLPQRVIKGTGKALAMAAE